MKNDTLVYQEAHYADVPITARIAPVLASIERSNIALVTVGILGGILVGTGLFLFGYRLGYLVGVLSPWYELRGWVILLLFAVAGTSGMIWYSNQR